jgi:flagellar export protein FliJ
MAFRYALQSILQLRRSLERQEEQRLFSFASIVGRLRAKLESLQQADMAQRRTALSEMEQFSSGAQLQFRNMCDSASQSEIQRTAMQLREAERLRHEQLQVYQEARQKREMFESLRERQEALYRREQTRRLQQRADEAYLTGALHNAED